MLGNKKIFFLIIIIILIFFSYNYVNQDTEDKKIILNSDEESLNNTNYNFNSNIILDVNYFAQDEKGNKYTINAKKGEIDIANTNIIFLTDVVAKIELNKSDVIKITANFGKYNIDNYDTIFSKNVIINYTDDKITGEYLDLSIINDLMIISKNVIYKNNENLLKADSIDITISTKDTKIYMYEDKKKVNVKIK
jgi:hypothetical protein